MQDDNPICQEYCPHHKIVQKLEEEQLSEDAIEQLAATFKVLGDSTRIKIIHALSNQELCVCDISELLNISQSAISHQLKKLRDLNLVKYRKEGRSVYYSLDDKHILYLFRQGLEHVLE